MISHPLPLFKWHEAREAERLCRCRKALLGRIQKLRPHSHKRVALEERLKNITSEQMKAELASSRERRDADAR